VPVKLGQRFDDQVEIISDEIQVGDELVVIGQARLVDGVKLEIVK
jgi:multidrug efflux pump subunit AcrA (membrane-fusion protein)